MQGYKVKCVYYCVSKSETCDDAKAVPLHPGAQGRVTLGGDERASLPVP